MDEVAVRKLLQEQMRLMDAAAEVLRESDERVGALLQPGGDTIKRPLTVGEKESCEALTSRFARLCDFLFQRMFRSIDAIELQDEGSGIDRLNRMEKRGIIPSAHEWRSLRDLRNSIVHDYLIESSDEVLRESHRRAHELLETVANIKTYTGTKGYL
ncbi:MAG: hypothetical protein HY646_04780 [Acidobacteria bacterium]|nr:hypothetical protein [Acidobacteriota bacterium]